MIVSRQSTEVLSVIIIFQHIFELQDVNSFRSRIHRVPERIQIFSRPLPFTADLIQELAGFTIETIQDIRRNEYLPVDILDIAVIAQQAIVCRFQRNKSHIGGNLTQMDCFRVMKIILDRDNDLAIQLMSIK